MKIEAVEKNEPTQESHEEPTLDITGGTASNSNKPGYSFRVNSQTLQEFRYDVVAGRDCSVADYSLWMTIETPIEIQLTGGKESTLCVQGRDANGHVQEIPISYGAILQL